MERSESSAFSVCLCLGLHRSVCALEFFICCGVWWGKTLINKISRRHFMAELVVPKLCHLLVLWCLPGESNSRKSSWRDSQLQSRAATWYHCLSWCPQSRAEQRKSGVRILYLSFRHCDPTFLSSLPSTAVDHEQPRFSCLPESHTSDHHLEIIFWGIIFELEPQQWKVSTRSACTPALLLFIDMHWIYQAPSGETGMLKCTNAS